MRTWACAAALGLAAIGGTAVPAAATMIVAEGSAAEAEAEAIDAMISQAFDLDETKKDAAFMLLVTARDRAAAAVQRFGSDPDYGALLRESQGHAAFYAAQYHDPDWDDVDGQKQEIVWLAEAAQLLGPILAETGGVNGPNYEYRGATEQLFNQALRFENPRLRGWSGERVLANRYRVKAFPDVVLEKNMLAEALYDHGWLTGDKALIDEASRIVDALPEEERSGAVLEKRDAVAAGIAPYRKPGD